MILDSIIKMNWNVSNKDHYISNGYVFTKLKDEFLIKVKDLSINSQVKINVECDICGNKKQISYVQYLKNYNNGNYYACSNKCAYNKNRETNKKIYGVENPQQNKEIRNKK
jgi:hypothetical protein